ncbi:hypothetical protein [Natrinema halophilum]|uniref:Uncharacterized protein n=1 Tax=Natrinema halophilum TaxID=1699371 RepID=A0A7D5H762_9EURY|nr:hypothetical protein [Natrinema halophilum]QLG49095.1 hypothetical protein HYG82_09650 [Natrinema halophilum]
MTRRSKREIERALEELSSGRAAAAESADFEISEAVRHDALAFIRYCHHVAAETQVHIQPADLPGNLIKTALGTVEQGGLTVDRIEAAAEHVGFEPRNRSTYGRGEQA